MLLASAWAPVQPELLQDGASCEVAACGTLEDPVRWRAAWVPWLVGCAAFTLAVVAVTPATGPRLAQVVVVGLVAPVWFVLCAYVALVVSWGTSVHGAATVMALGFAAPCVAVLTGWCRGVLETPR